MARILIIDDDADLVEALKIVLESRGHVVESAPEGDAGYELARSLRPDLVILDVMMRTKDQGFQVSYRLKNNPELSSIPILMLTSVGAETGFSFGPDDEDYMAADDFAEKPIKPEELLERVERLLGGRPA
ncbi:MAG TPA: response regulator transcription factor [Deltaproteobacteria bacterium]|nr:response regulator transcription factor [Deltaproteobacteria bacterium]